MKRARSRVRIASRGGGRTVRLRPGALEIWAASARGLRRHKAGQYVPPIGGDRAHPVLIYTYVTASFRSRRRWPVSNCGAPASHKENIGWRQSSFRGRRSTANEPLPLCADVQDVDGQVSPKLIVRCPHRAPPRGGKPTFLLWRPRCPFQTWLLKSRYKSQSHSRHLFGQGWRVHAAAFARAN